MGASMPPKLKPVVTMPKTPSATRYSALSLRHGVERVAGLRHPQETTGGAEG